MPSSTHVDNQWYVPYPELQQTHNWDILGYSSEQRPILTTSIGSGERSICIWAGMHGNETTGVFIILDLIKELQLKQSAYSEFTFHFIPVINPDAYVRYTRRNGMGIDLNRDFRSFQTIESAKLLGWLKMNEPELCFNLHDQRTIFHTGEASAFTSLLVPSSDISRSITPLRRALMNRVGQTLAAMNQPLVGIGKYTDEFYPTAVGDYLMAAEIPNILIESGVHDASLSRSKAREFGCRFIQQAVLVDSTSSSLYDELPFNQQGQLEWVFTNVLYARMRVDVAVRQVRYVSGHQTGTFFVVDDIGDLASRPRLLSIDASSFAVTEPLEIDRPITADFGDYFFENGILIAQ